MPLPLVVPFLRYHSIADLMHVHGVRVAVSKDRPYKASLNYDQISAKDADALACECRGLVLATADGSPIPATGPVGDLVVLARPMDRFFNLGQGAAHAVDDEGLLHSDARVFEKLDGTLCILYWDPHMPSEFDGRPGEWCVATRSVPDADRPVDGFKDHTFRSLFERAIRSQHALEFDELTSWLRHDWTYCFELCSPRAGSGVVRYADDRVYLLAVRDRDGLECDPDEAVVGAPHSLLDAVCPSHRTSSLEALLSVVESRSPAEAEGVVVRLAGRSSTGGFRRVKVKSSAYVAAHGLSSEAGSSPRNLLRIILRGAWDDVGPLCPVHLRERGDDYVRRLASWCARVDASYDRIRPTVADGDRKAFALAVQETGLQIAPLMSRWQGQTADARAWIESRRGRDGDLGDGFLDTLTGYLDAEPDAQRNVR